MEIQLDEHKSMLVKYITIRNSNFANKKITQGDFNPPPKVAIAIREVFRFFTALCRPGFIKP